MAFQLGISLCPKRSDTFKSEAELAEPRSQAKMVIRRLSRNSEPQATIECGKYNIQ